LVVLVHGFNVNRQSGQDGYSAFGTLLEKYGVQSLSVLGQIVGFCWPGDVNIRYISGLFYPGELGPAKASAALLANFLVRLRGPQGVPIQVIFVAHSLGNQLASELINSVLDQPNQTWGRIEGLCLMAAAVRSGWSTMATDLRVLRAQLNRELFSNADTVLHWAFPAGDLCGRFFLRR
jgi:esterase/lipase superfamily enzyme